MNENLHDLPETAESAAPVNEFTAAEEDIRFDPAAEQEAKAAAAVAAVKPPDFGGYKLLEIVFNGEKEAELAVTPFELKADNGDIISGNTYKVVSYDEDGTEYECPVKPARASDKIFLKMLLR